MSRPNFQPIFTEKSEFSEVSSDKPVNTFVPHQAMSLAELVSRFEKGQRLNVHSNFPAGDNFQRITDDEALASIRSESMDTDDFPPVGVHDIAEVQSLYEEHEVHKREFTERMKTKKKEAQQAKPKQAQQADDNIPLAQQ